MIKIESYLEAVGRALRERFGDRLLYLGLQGSYARGEAGEESDIDLFVLLDRVEAADLDAYREMLRSLGEEEKSCGFLAARADLAHWNPCEICQILHETQDCFGKLSDFVPPYTRADVRCYVKLLTGNLYPELCHRYLHAPREENERALAGSCRVVFYILQNLQYLRSGRYPRTRAELRAALTGTDREALDLESGLRAGKQADFDKAFSLLLAWCQKTLGEEEDDRAAL